MASCVILALWGISAAGSASHWQCEGHGFESRMLQEKEYLKKSGFHCRINENPLFYVFVYLPCKRNELFRTGIGSQLCTNPVAQQNQCNNIGQNHNGIDQISTLPYQLHGDDGSHIDHDNIYQLIVGDCAGTP